MAAARRRLLLTLLIAGLAVLALGGLGVTIREGAPAYVESTVGRPSRINPITAHASDAEDDLAALIFSGLMRVGADGVPQADLARSWELTPDGRTYTFHLRPGLTWHDGYPVTAADVSFTIARIQAPGSGASPALAAAWSGIEVVVADADTVIIRTPEPLADFLVRAAVGILPRHLEAQMTASNEFAVPPFDRRPVGTGPYRLHALTADHALLDRHPGFALGAPHIARLEFRFAADAAGQVRDIRDGTASAALLPDQSVEGDEDALARRPQLVATPLTRTGYTALYMNTAREPLTDVALRRAIAASLDRVEVATAAGVRGIAGDSVIVPGSWAYQHVPAAPPDPEAAWSAAGWARTADGTRAKAQRPLALDLVTNDDPARATLADRVAAQLGAQGVLVRVVTLPAARVIADRLRTGNFDLAIFGWEAGGDPDPYPGWHASQAGDGGNIAAFRDAEASALLEAARTTMDTAERVELYGLFLRRFADQVPAIVLWYPARAYIHPTALRGAQPGLLVTSGSRFHDVYKWRLN
ncbi:MAG: peptide ABC transporter substrate-binding protein [Dehalococcoidia bacterium]